jgi:ADP-dependent NAD(P)H-hydrate dehydratase / NAD(P)H-hydrate epimerase
VRSAYDAAAVRAAEEQLLASLPPGTLMQRAATALARRCAAVLGRVYGARVVLLVGSGNNGGDALFAGAQLARRGARVDALLVKDGSHAEALAVFRAAGGHVHDSAPVTDALVTRADLVVDGMLGIGGRGGLRDEAARVAAVVDDCAAVVVAVDVPSGIDASSGRVDGSAVHADLTVTFGALKSGLVVAPGALHAGLVEVVDIGLSLPPADVTLLDADDVARLVPAAEGETDKYRRGVVGVVAGSDTYTGATVLAVGGALGAGAGMVRYVGATGPAALVRRHWPEAVVTEAAPGDCDAVLAAGRVQAWVVGSGLGTDDAAAAVVRAMLKTDLPVVVDADAVTVVAADPAMLRGRSAPTILTPHAGEFARLRALDRADVEANRLELVRAAAADLGVVVLLKGATTLVAEPSGHVRVNSADTPYLATAGSGDVLSGVCGTLLAAGATAADAAAAGAFLHGLAGLEAAGSPAAAITAMDIATRLPSAVRAVRG